MKDFFAKPFRWEVVFLVLLVFFTSYVLLDTFVIPKTGKVQPVNTTSTSPQEVQTTQQATQPNATIEETSSVEEGLVTENSYQDENIQITIETKQTENTTYYVADIQVSDISYLKTAFANATYGRNIKQKTSEMAEENAAVLAINGDYYGFRDEGYVIRNGMMYRNTVKTSGTDEDLVIDSEGNFSIINESEISAEKLLAQGAWQVLSFGPALVENSEIAVEENTEVDQAKTSNPRTAIGQVSELHYKIIVSDGRTDESEGLTLYELAELFQEEGCTVAYNLDGGGSSTMVFNGQIINKPTTGKTISERSVSDIVYFG